MSQTTESAEKRKAVRAAESQRQADVAHEDPPKILLFLPYGFRIRFSNEKRPSQSS